MNFRGRQSGRFLRRSQRPAAFVVSVFTPWGITYGAIPIAITHDRLVLAATSRPADRRRAREIWQSE